MNNEPTTHGESKMTATLTSGNNPNSTKTVNYNAATMRVETKNNSATFIKFHKNGMATITTQGANCNMTVKRYIVNGA